MNEITIGSSIPRRGNTLSRYIGLLALKLMGGWKVTGELPNTEKMVVLMGPHTSNWDFIVSISVVLALQIEVHFLAKHSLFTGIFGPIMRALGGIAINRNIKSGVVEQMTNEYAQRDNLILAMSPEGTRKKIDLWKTGGLRIAHASKIPVVIACLDFSKRQVIIGPTLETTSDTEADMQLIKTFFTKTQARHPRNI